MMRGKTIQYTLLGALTCTITLASLFVLVHQRDMYKILVTYKLVPLPETFTELYFNNHQRLSLFPKNQEKTFSFTIHNLENKDVIYPYSVVLTAKGVREDIDEKSVAIKNNATKEISEHFPVATNEGRLEVMVLLKNKNQEIHFWLGGDTLL